MTDTVSTPRTLRNFVGGEYVDSTADERLDIVDPSTGEEVPTGRTMHEVLQVSNRAGLVSYLTGGADFESIISRTSVPNLFVIPAGPNPPNPSSPRPRPPSRSPPSPAPACPPAP